VLATKVFGKMHDGPGGQGLSRKAILGATKPHHLTEAVAALDLHLTDDETRALQEPYTPHGPSWF
jgi:aryl-alcohol dehydrogenase-like predicted oxidoreductase